MKTQKILFQLVYSTEELFSKSENKPTAYADYLLTDIKIHASSPRKPSPLIRQVEKSTRSGKYNRTYSDGKNVCKDADHTVETSFSLFENDAAIIKAKERALKENKILRIYAPQDGLPIFAAKDAVEFVKAHPELVEKMQRIDRSKKRRKI